LPLHLRHHERRMSRVDVDALYADSPIESSLFSLYIHQNYPQFCNEIEETEGVADWLSWVDSSGGDAVRFFSFPRPNIIGKYRNDNVVYLSSGILRTPINSTY